jgi:hypothetical protein
MKMKCVGILKLNFFTGPAKETGTGTDDIAAGSPQHALQQQEAQCV